MEDVSKTTIAVLLILVILTSVIGTWVVLDTLVSITEKPEIQTKSSGNIVKELPKSASSSGNIALEVLPPFELREEG